MDAKFDITLYDASGKVPTLSEAEVKSALETLKTVQAGQSCYADSLGWHNVSEWAGED
jgi:hypothetical protein